MKTKEFREMSSEKLALEINNLSKAAYGLRVQLATQQHNKTSEKRRIRRLIARAKTIQMEKTLVNSAKN